MTSTTSSKDPALLLAGAIISQHLADIAGLFKDGTKLTFIARQPGAPNGSQDLVQTDDDLLFVARALHQRHDAAAAADRFVRVSAYMLDELRANPSAPVRLQVRELEEGLLEFVATGATNDERDAARWRALEPFLQLTEDGDGDSSWENLSLRDKDTGDTSIEISPAATGTPGAFVDHLIASPRSRSGCRR